jgi:uncharacterized alkaline shock family protein YloU
VSDERVIEGEGGSITISASALAQVVQRAAESVDGARVRRPRRGLELDVDGDRARVELDLAVRYGLVVTDLAREVQERVASALATMGGLRVEKVDVCVSELDGA